MAAHRKLNVLWTCDVPGWAYHNRIMRLSRAMPHYHHTIFFFGQRIPRDVMRHMLDNADVIVCQGVKSLRVVDDKADHSYANIVSRLDSMRIDINGEYFDIWAKQEENQ